MSVVVFWLTPSGTEHEECGENLNFALQLAEAKRRFGYRHVCISCENPDSVGSKGVAAVEDGKTPDGYDYTWKKRR